MNVKIMADWWFYVVHQSNAVLKQKSRKVFMI